MSSQLAAKASTKKRIQKQPKQKKDLVEDSVTTVAELQDYWDDTEQRFRDEKGEIDYNRLLRSVNVQGDTQVIGSKDYTHPVAKLLHERRRNNSTFAAPGERRADQCRVALAIEGGGMRGCISAGMICAIHHLNLTSHIDVVYGSSAGTVVGAYFITEQLPWFGPEVYYDQLTTAGRKFIDARRLLRALGLGLLDPRLLRDVITRARSGGKPVLNLSYLLKTTVQESKPLNWTKFVELQEKQPLKIVASALKSEKSIVMDLDSGSFTTLDEMTDCMHASCLLPGIAGPLMNLNRTAVENGESPKMVMANNLKGDDIEPLADALCYEPLPYRSAIADGATHVIVVRSRPDGVDVTGKGGFFERLIFRRFFMRKNRLPHVFRYFSQHRHKRLYGEDILRLNDEAYNVRDYKDTSKPSILTVALPPGSAEITRLETGREAIFEGFRRGFARAYDCLVEDPSERGRGAIVAKEYFPDEIMDYDPHAVAMQSEDESAFEAHLRQLSQQEQNLNI